MKKNLLLTAAAMPLLAVLCLASCESENLPTKFNTQTIPVSWAPYEEEITIAVGETAMVAGLTTYDDGSTCEVNAICTSRDDEVILAEGSFKILGLAPGTAYVDARVAYYAADDVDNPIAVFQKDIKVTVTGSGSEVTSLELSPAEVSLKRGDEVTLKVFVTCADGTKREISPKVCKWSVTDDGEQHVIYDSDGNVRGMQGTGDTVLTAKYTEGGVTVKGSSKIHMSD